jgi:hypothetical protein
MLLSSCCRTFLLGSGLRSFHVLQGAANGARARARVAASARGGIAFTDKVSERTPVK